MGSVVRQFTREAGRTGLGQGKHRVNYGAAVRDNLDRLARAKADFEGGALSSAEFTELMQMQMETALGATASGINALTEGMNTLFGLTDKQIGVMKFMSGSLQTTRAMIGMYRMWVTARKAREAREMAAAAAETTAMLATQQYHRVALALGGVAFFAAAFGAGYVGGREIYRRGSIDTHAGRRDAIASIREGS